MSPFPVPSYVLAWRLEQNIIAGSGIADITKPFTIPFTAYIDGIRDGGFFNPYPENRRPPLSLFHCNQYQRNGFPRGSQSGGDIDVNRSDLLVIHDTIEDHPVVLDLLRMKFLEHVVR